MLIVLFYSTLHSLIYLPESILTSFLLTKHFETILIGNLLKSICRFFCRVCVFIFWLLDKQIRTDLGS